MALIDCAGGRCCGRLTGIDTRAALVELMRGLPMSEAAVLKVRVPGPGGPEIGLGCTIGSCIVEQDVMAYRLYFLRNRDNLRKAVALQRLLRERDSADDLE